MAGQLAVNNKKNKKYKMYGSERSTLEILIKSYYLTKWKTMSAEYVWNTLLQYAQTTRLPSADFICFYLYQNALIACNENYTDVSSILFSLVQAII